MSRNSVFLSSSDRDLGVAFKVHPWSQASSRVEAKSSALLSSCDVYLLEPIKWPKGSQASRGDLREDSGLLSRPFRKRRPSSCYDWGVSCFFSSCGASVGFLKRYDGELREPLIWCQGSQISMRVGSFVELMFTAKSPHPLPLYTLMNI